MDVSGWSMGDRMQLPDWCFPSRMLIGCWIQISVGATFLWVMSVRTLPDPCCLWSFGCVIADNDHRSNYIRMALGTTLPVNQAEMSALTPVLPYFGRLDITPPYVFLQKDYGPGYHIQHQKGLVTGSKKLIVEGFTNAAASSLYACIYIVVSDLPKKVPAHLDPNTV